MNPMTVLVYAALLAYVAGAAWSAITTPRHVNPYFYGLPPVRYFGRIFIVLVAIIHIIFGIIHQYFG